MHYNHHADETIRKLSKIFGSVLVTGARQVGKTTLLHEVVADAGYVTLDDKIQLAGTREQGGTFFKDGGVLYYPIEIKKHADPVKSDVSRLSILDKLPIVKRAPSRRGVPV